MGKLYESGSESELNFPSFCFKKGIEKKFFCVLKRLKEFVWCDALTGKKENLRVFSRSLDDFPILWGDFEVLFEWRSTLFERKLIDERNRDVYHSLWAIFLLAEGLWALHQSQWSFEEIWKCNFHFNFLEIEKLFFKTF